tara:strand:+ start:2261 stop:2461 length:201 start_codon:yes stop_codon:yes gene_type:complete
MLNPKIIESITKVTELPIVPKRKKYQNSDLDALPEKTAYLLKHVIIDVPKSMIFYNRKKILISSLI